MVEDAPESVRGTVLVVALLVILLAIPLVALVMSWMRRARSRCSGTVARRGRNALGDAWVEAGRRGRTPSATELERQFGEGRDGGDP